MKLNPFSAIFLFICLAAAALLSTLSSPVFLFSLFNSMVLAVVIGSCKPSPEEIDGAWSSLQSSFGVQDYPYDEDSDDGTFYDVSSEEDEEFGGEEELDGYEEDDDEDGTEGEVGWDDEEEVDDEDDELEERAQEFIMKVTKGWRDELLKETCMISG
ncbi:hypothetical protein LINPERPRIM_LOCUS35944 [Linum perenne]